MNMATITHSSDGIRITYEGRIETFPNSVYLGEAYARQMEVIDSLESHLSTASESARMAKSAMSDIAAIVSNYKKDGDMMVESDIKTIKRILSQWDMPF